MDRRGLTIIVILVLALLGAGGWGVFQASQNKTLKLDKADLSEELAGIESLKSELSREVDSLQQAYQTLADENQTLQGSLADAQSQLAQKDAQIRAARSNSLGTINGLRAEIQGLLAVKAELENSISSLQMENDSLRIRTGDLERDLGIAQEEKQALANLNQTIQGELKRLTLANFKATAFQVEVEGRRPVVTAKSGRARRIIVNFDLTEVPQEYQGVRPLYMVITDDKGLPVTGSNIQAKSVVNGQTVELLAVKARDVNITNNQRLSFSHDVEDRLKAGYYRVSIYTNIGLLGAASFRLE